MHNKSSPVLRNLYNPHRDLAPQWRPSPGVPPQRRLTSAAGTVGILYRFANVPNRGSVWLLSGVRRTTGAALIYTSLAPTPIVRWKLYPLVGPVVRYVPRHVIALPPILPKRRERSHVIKGRRLIGPEARSSDRTVSSGVNGA